MVTGAGLFQAVTGNKPLIIKIENKIKNLPRHLSTSQ
jgi:hypothetical protein